MQQNILQFIKNQRVGVLAVEMLDGAPHAATVHFAHGENPFVLYFETHKDSKKCEPLLKKEKTRASYVIGSNENDMKTLQVDGVVSIISDGEKERYDAVYLGKFPGKKEKSKDPKFVRLLFIPTWWRFTEWTAEKGKVILTSEAL